MYDLGRNSMMELKVSSCLEDSRWQFEDEAD